MTYKLLEFLHDTDRTHLDLGADGFRADRQSDDRVSVHYEGRLLCDIVPDGFQFLLTIPLPLSVVQCRRMTEVFAMLGKPNLRAVCDGTSSRIQGLVRGRPSRYQILKHGVTFGVYV